MLLNQTYQTGIIYLNKILEEIRQSELGYLSKLNLLYLLYPFWNQKLHTMEKLSRLFLVPLAHKDMTI